jgi:glucose/mannose-6-phosphate isomerase
VISIRFGFNGFGGFGRDNKKTYDQHIKAFPEYITDAIKRTGSFRVDEDIKQIVVAGVGVNSIAGDILKGIMDAENAADGLGSKSGEGFAGISVNVVSGHELPSDAGKKTLIFAVSYSGNDDEVLSIQRAAPRRGCKVIGITSGGELKKSLERSIKEHIIVPEGLPECAAIPYLLFPMLTVLQNSGLIKSSGSIKEVTDDLTNTPYHTTAQQFSENLKGKIVLIYSSQKLLPVAKRWKMQINNIAKVPSFFSTIGEAAQAELNGFGNRLGDYHIILLKDADDSEKVMKQAEAMKFVLRKLSISSTEIVVKKKSMLAKLLTSIFIGDWIAYYLSQKYSTAGQGMQSGGQTQGGSQQGKDDAVEMFRNEYNKA